MKKTVLFAAALCLASTAMAQTAGNPLTATNGTNTYTAQKGGSYYWSFVADKDYVVTISPCEGSAEAPIVSYREPGNPDATALKSSFIGNNSYMYIFRKGFTYIFDVYTQSASNIGFSLKLEETKYEGTGLKEENPAEIKLNETQVFGDPLCPEESYDPTTIYTKYIAEKDGELQIQTPMYVNSAKVNANNVTPKEEKGYNVFKINVTAGETYEINFSTESPVFTATSKLVEAASVTKGSIDDPFVMNVGDNTIPAAAGKYYFTYTPNKKGYIKLTSDATSEGVQVSVYKFKFNATSGNNAIAKSEVNSYNVRAEIDNLNTTYYIVVDKTTASAKDETFKFQTEDYKPGENADSAFDITMGNDGANITLPEAEGTYYYKVEVPANTNKFLVVEPTTNLSAGSSACINQTPTTGYGATKMNKNIIKKYVNDTSAKTYYFIVTSKETEPLKFKFSYVDVEKGELLSNPKQAELGKNTIDFDGEEHFVYKASKNCKLAVTVSDGVKVKFPISATGYGTNDTYINGNVYAIEAKKDAEYLISLSDVTKGSTFTLAETEFEAGEVRSNPISITEETYTLSENAANLWLKFEVTKTGVIDFGCDVPFDYNNFIGIAKNDAQSPVSMADEVQGKPEPESSWIPRERVYQALFPVTKGDILYIQVQVSEGSKGKKLTLTQRTPEAGETIECPIVIKKGETIDVSKASLKKPIFVKANLTEGKNTFEMTEGTFTPQRNCKLDKSSGMTYYGGEVNWEEDGIHFSETYSDELKDITFMIGYAEGNAKMTYLGDSATGIAGIEAIPDSKPSIYTLDGTKIDQISGNGVYIIKMNGKTKKVVIKK